MRMLTWFVVWLLVTLSGGSAHAAPRPVVVIPGIMGSKLCKGPQDNLLWGDALSYSLPRLQALRLPDDPATRDPEIHSCGLIEEISVIPFFWETNIYADLLATLRKPEFGYSKDDIVIFHYDWRLSNFDNAEELKRQIQRRFPNNSTKIDIVAHSMGGLIARIYVQSLGGADRVKNLIMLGTPHLGSAVIFERLWNGFEKWPNRWSGGLAQIQQTILSFPSTYELLPRYSDCCGLSKTGLAEGASYIRILDPQEWTRFSWLPSEFRSGPGLKSLARKLESAGRLKELMAQPIFADPQRSLDIRFIGNGFIDTWSRVFFDPANGFITGHVANIGDGTVLLESATNGVPKQVQISRMQHDSLFSGSQPELILRLALSDQQFHQGPVDFSEQLVDAKNTKVQLSSVRFEVDPRTATVGEPIKIGISLRSGDDGWRRADLRNLQTWISKNGRAMPSLILAEEQQGADEQVRRLVATIPSLPEEGTYEVNWQLPGIRTYQSLFVVVKP
ncbi:alpha/beta fold hydrolase [Bradyrhizobium sp. 26S5]|uniref:lipase family alpha/beta hydrolase n=1 Tax=Bradyrhizobium sp. 26S5 TaxID=3139729 RepID=UPI0030CEFDE4